MQNEQITRMGAPRGPGSMTRGTFFGEMNYSRLKRLLGEGELYISRHNQCGESVVRCCSFMQFCCVSLFSLITVVTPWMLNASEFVIMLVIYCAAFPDSMDDIADGSLIYDEFASNKNLKDVLIFSVIRAILLSVSYAFAFNKYRPYYFIAWITSVVLIPYCIVKGVLTELDPLGPSLALLLTSMLFSIVHVIVAHATMKRLQRRHNMGLSRFYSTWDEDEWVMGGIDSIHSEETVQQLLLSVDSDVPRDILADSDSKFIECGGISVHYKEEFPREGTDATLDPSFAILLIHGFGGGVFSWRHVMAPLAELCRCRVVAFDRPAFGLTARPKCDATSTNPYSLQSQQMLIFDLCEKLGIKKVMTVAHSDGCLLELMLGAALNPLQQSHSQKLSKADRNLLKSGSMTKAGRIAIGLPIRRASSEALERSPSSDDEAGSATTTSPTINAILNPRARPGLSILTMVFLHPDLSCDEVSSFTSLLKQSKIARSVLRPLLRSDIGEVANRRAWYDTSKLTKEILQLYKAPLRIRGWDSALVAYTKERKTITADDVNVLIKRGIGVPMLIVTGEKDRIVPPERMAVVADDLHAEHRSILANCGHLSHEEVPGLLLQTLVAYMQHICDLYEDL